MNIATWIILGGVVGWLVYLVAGRGAGLIIHIVVGIIGGTIGCFVYEIIKRGEVITTNLYSVLLAVAGVIGLLFVLGLVRKQG